jgi:cyclopropane fatty-acyl-phospholipid synthase-like methyltransferase
VTLADRGEIRAPVLDSGCGTGEHALFLAERGMDVIGVDLSPTAIALARQKADERGVAVEFEIADVLDLGRSGRRFATVIDSGVFHVFDDADRARYVASLASITEPAGVVHLLCFSDQVHGEAGPRRVSKAELREAFADGWSVERIEPAHFDVREWVMERPHAWLARIVRSQADPTAQ